MCRIEFDSTLVMDNKYCRLLWNHACIRCYVLCSFRVRNAVPARHTSDVVGCVCGGMPSYGDQLKSNYCSPMYWGGGFGWINTIAWLGQFCEWTQWFRDKPSSGAMFGKCKWCFQLHCLKKIIYFRIIWLIIPKSEQIKALVPSLYMDLVTPYESRVGMRRGAEVAQVSRRIVMFCIYKNPSIWFGR